VTVAGAVLGASSFVSARGACKFVFARTPAVRTVLVGFVARGAGINDCRRAGAFAIGREMVGRSLVGAIDARGRANGAVEAGGAIDVRGARGATVSFVVGLVVAVVVFVRGAIDNLGAMFEILDIDFLIAIEGRDVLLAAPTFIGLEDNCLRDGESFAALVASIDFLGDIVF
jgi:hypothetical protein